MLHESMLASISSVTDAISNMPEMPPFITQTPMHLSHCQFHIFLVIRFFDNSQRSGLGGLTLADCASVTGGQPTLLRELGPARPGIF
jgi:hypothetical protein